MVRPNKPPSRKPQRGVIDFKKVKRKIGRKLPPPRNATTTEVKSKAIVLPEQSVASERAGLAVSSKGLTLKELLRQSSHHNVRLRRSALTGIRDLFLNNLSELQLHKLITVEKLRERLTDSDKGIRDIFYQLLRDVIFASSKETGASDSVVSLLMTYVFNAMTHLALDIRLTAFKFLDLIVTSYPSSAFTYAEKVLDHYKDILQNSQIYLQELSGIKAALRGFVNFLSLLAPDREKADTESSNQEALVEAQLLGYIFEPRKEMKDLSSIFGKLEELIPFLVRSFTRFSPASGEMGAVSVHSFDCICSVIQCIKLITSFLFRKVNQSQLSEGCNLMVRIFASLKKLWDPFPFLAVHQLLEKKDDKCYILNARISEIFFQFIKVVEKNSNQMGRFLEFFEHSLWWLVNNKTGHSVMAREKHLAPLISHIPMFVFQVTADWRIRILEAFTHVFQERRVESKIVLVYLNAIEEMLLISQGKQLHDCLDSDISVYQSCWLRNLPGLLLHIQDRNPPLSKVILRLLLRIAQCCPPNSSLDLEINNLQSLLRDFYFTPSDSGGISNGPFLKLPKECQELSVSSLYYFSSLKPEFLQSLTCCCLCSELEPSMALRIMEVIHSAYKVGRIYITDYISFLVTIAARFHVYHGKFHVEGDPKIMNSGAFKEIGLMILYALGSIGDAVLISRLLKNKVLDEMNLKPSVDNMHCMLKMIAMLDSTCSQFSGKEVFDLSQSISLYLINIASCMPVVHCIEEIPASWGYYMKPCLFLFNGSEVLLSHVMQLLFSQMSESNSLFTIQNRVNTVVFVLISFLGDSARQSASLTRHNIENAVKVISMLVSPAETSLNFEEQLNVHAALALLKVEAEKANILQRNS